MATLDKKLAPGDFEFRRDESLDDHFKRTDVALQQLCEVSEDLKPGQIVGAILRFPCADGYAMYRVSKDKPLTLQHIPYGDRWQVEPALIRGLRRVDVERMVEQNRRVKTTA